ncbi:MAG: selenite/tellurite reduction operon rhodanese-like protein ExtH [Rubrivivax sp.]|nr:selenite/tellurite reduction operon rhodanese-like protein ExtH [Rubrivivax sp.]
MLTRRTLQFGLAGLLMSATLVLVGCGGSSDSSGYPDPTASITTTKTANALIEPATLKQWVDEGKLNNSDAASLDRVVVITVGTPAQYGAQHIPGAQLLNSSTELLMTRLEGVGSIGTMVLDGPTMDALIQRLCINSHTTIVFVASKNQNALNAARAYFTFRYWGFPKERLKVLNGGENGWESAATTNNWGASYALTNVATPALSPSTFSVKNLYVYNGSSTASFGLRASIGEMLSVVDRINNGSQAVDATGVSILDVRGGNPAVYVQNAAVDDYAQYALSGVGNTSTFKPTAEIIARLSSFGVTEAKSMIYVYCASGVRAASTFFVLDGILGWNVSMYDGSWNQWSAYASTATANKVATAWQTDVNTAGTSLSRTFGAIATAGTGVVLDPTSNAMYSAVTDRRANQILNEDKAYITSGSGSSTPGDGGDGGGPSGC